MQTAEDFLSGNSASDSMSADAFLSGQQQPPQVGQSVQPTANSEQPLATGPSAFGPELSKAFNSAGEMAASGARDVGEALTPISALVKMGMGYAQNGPQGAIDNLSPEDKDYLDQGAVSGALSPTWDALKALGKGMVGGAGLLGGEVLSAGNRAFVGNPLENATGIPSGLTDFAMSLGEPMALSKGFNVLSKLPLEEMADLPQEMQSMLSKIPGMFNNAPKEISPDNVVSGIQAAQAASPEITGSTTPKISAPTTDIPLSGGQSSQMPDLQRFEADSLAGAKGAGAQSEALKFSETQQQAVSEMLQNLGEYKAGGNPADSIGSVAKLVRANEGAADAEVNQAYKTAKGLSGGLNLSADDMQQNLVPNLKEFQTDFGIKPETTPKAASQLTDLVNLSRNTTGKALLTDGETWRRATTNLAANSTDPADAKALRGLVNQYDGYMSGLSDRLSSGTTQSNLQGQLESQFGDITAKKQAADKAVAAAQTQMTIAQAAKQTTSNVYGMNSALQKEKEAQAALDSATEAQQTLGSQRDAIASRLQEPNNKNAADAINAFKNAVATRAAYGDKFQGNPIVENLVSGNKTVDDLTEDLLGKGQVGNRQGMLDNLNGILRASGEHAPVVKAQLQNAYAQRIYDTVSGSKIAGTNIDSLSLPKLQTALENTFIKNREFATALYGPDAVTNAQEAIKTLDLANSRQANVGNAPSSGYTAARLMQNAGGWLSHVPMLKHIVNALSAMAKASSEGEATKNAAQTFSGVVPESFMPKSPSVLPYGAIPAIGNVVNQNQ